MKITVDGLKEMVTSTGREEFNTAWLECTSEIYQAERLIYCVAIDGQVLYNHYEQFIQEHLQKIEHVHIKTLSRFDSIHDTKDQLAQYLIKFIPGISSIADCMYGDMSADQWGDLAEGLEGLQWIVSSFEFLKLLFNPDLLICASMSIRCTVLGSLVKELYTNLEGEDLVAVADLIKYELIPYLEDSQAEIGRLKVDFS